MHTPIQIVIQTVQRWPERPVRRTERDIKMIKLGIEYCVSLLKVMEHEERAVIEKAFLAGYISDNVNGPTTGEEFYNKTFGSL